MAVAESAVSQGKSPGTTAGNAAVMTSTWGEAMIGAVRALTFGIWSALGMVMWMNAAHAQIIADPNAPGNQRPTTLTTANNIPLVNIQTPSAAGVSRNTYSQFDVQQQGAILNNASGNVQTQLGGWVQGNPWLANGTARVILNEVNSSNSSLLRGYIEVAGTRAQVVIANPSGITCDGCGFINTNRATLTTGTAIINGGNLDGYRAQGGMITVTGSGMDARATDYTDLIARSIQINAGIWANQLKLTAGANQVDAANVQAIPIAATGPAPAFAIDVAQLGGMYAGKIMLVGTEAGVGMRNAGQIGASAGNVIVTANGRLENAGSLTSTGNTQLNAENGIQNSGTIYAQADASISTRGDINNSGVIAAQGNTALTANGATSSIISTPNAVLGAGIQTDGSAGSAGSLTMNATQAITAQGQNISGGDQNMTAQAINIAGSQTSAGNLGLDAAAGNIDATAANLSVAQTMNAHAAQTLHTDRAQILAEQINIDAHDVSNVQGQILQVGTGDFSLNLPGQLDNTSGRIAVNSQNVNISAGTIANKEGALEHAGTGNLTLATNTLDGTQGKISSNGKVDIAATAATLDAATTTAKQLRISSTVLSNRGGTLQQTGSDATAISASAQFDNTGGTLLSNGSTTLAVGDLINDGGIIQASGPAPANLAIQATGNIDNRVQAGTAGQLYASGTVAITANQLDNSGGQIAATKSLSANITGTALNQQGSIAANQDVVVNARNIDNTQGTIGSVQGRIDIVSSNGALNNTSGHIEAANAITASSQGLNNAGGTITGSSIALDSRQQALDNAKGTIASTGGDNGTISIQSGALNNNAGLISAQGALSVDTHGLTLTNTNSGNTGGIIGQGTITLVSGDLDNHAGYIGSNGTLTVNGGAIDNTQGGILTSASRLDLTSAMLDNQGGQIQVMDNASITTSGAVNNTSGLMRSGQTLTINADAIDNGNTQGNDQGLEGDSVSLSANHIGNQKGAIRANTSVTQTSSGSIDNTQGLVSATGTVTLKDNNLSNKTLAIANTGGTMIAGQQLAVDSNSLGGDGSLLSQGDLNVKLDASYTQTGLLQANGTASLETAATLTNASTMTAGTALNLKAATIDNQAGGQIKSTTLSLQATDSHTLTNRGLINGSDTFIDTVTLNNLGTGRIYGDNIAISATTVTNNAENGVAPVIAARNRLDIGASDISNNEHALIFSAGDLAIGGSLDASKRATGQAGTLNNNSATVEALGNVDISANRISNNNLHLSTADVVVGTQSIVEYQGSGSPNRYAEGTPGVSTYVDESIHLQTPEGPYESWSSYNYARTTVETKVQSSDPGKILAGGNMRIAADTLNNSNSHIIAGGNLTGNVGHLNNLSADGQRTITDAGTVTSYWRNHKKGTDDTGSSSADYQPAPVIQTISLNAIVYQGNTSPGVTGTQISSLSVGNVSQSAAGASTASVNVHNGPSVTPITQVAALGANNASGTNTVVRSGGINTSVPNSSLYSYQPKPGAHYLVATDPAFADYRTWLSSDYMLAALSVDPATTQRRLGDGFYEQRLVQEQVAQLTGRRFLDGYADNEAEYRGLIDNAVTYAKQWNLRPGVALTDEQMAQLTSDIVWLVEKDVTLPNGQTTRALVPQVYVRVKDGDLDGSGALLAGQSVNMNIAGNLVNTGTIAGRTFTSITAENIQNLGGRISGADTSVNARTDLANIGGKIEGARSLTATAGRDLTVASTTRTQSNAQGTRTGISQVGSLTVTDPGGTMVVAAGRDITLRGAAITNEAAPAYGQPAGSTTIVAGNNLNLDTVAQASSNNIVWDGKNSRRDAASTEIGTTVSATGDIQLSAGRDINARAATVTSDKGALVAVAGNNITLTTGESSRSVDEAHQHTSKGFLSKKTITTRDTIAETQAVASEFGGESVTLQAGKDLNIRGSSVAGSGDVTLTASTGNINIAAAQDTLTESHYKQEKKSGIFASGVGIGFTVGSQEKTSNFDGATTSQSQSRSVVGSTGGNVIITAGKDVAIQGSDLIAARAAGDIVNATGHIDIQAQNITIDPGQDTSRTKSTLDTKSSGMTVALVGTPLDTFRNIKDAQKNESKFGRVRGTLDEIAASGLTAPQVAVNFDRSKSHSEVSTNDLTNSGSSLTAAGDVRLRATGSGQTDAAGKAADGNITVTGSSITAGGTVQLDAQRDITVQASTDRYTQSSQANSSSTHFSTAGASLGDTLRQINGGPNNSGVGAVPYGKASSSDMVNSSASVQSSSVIRGEEVILNSRTGDIRIAGSGIQAIQDITVAAQQGKIDITSGEDQRTLREDHTQKLIGDLGKQGSTGTSNTVGVYSIHTTLDATQNQQNTIRSQLIAGGNLTLDAKDNLTVQGADLRAGKDLTAIGRNIVLDQGQDTSLTKQTNEMHQAGTTLSLSGYAVEAAQAVEQAANAYEKKDNKRLATLYGAKAALTLYNGVSGTGSGPLDAAQTPSNSAGAAIKVTASIGSKSASSQSEVGSTQNQGSTLTAGQTVTLIATGNGDTDAQGKAIDGDITARGTRIAGQDVVLAAARDITLQSGQDTTKNRSSDHSSNASVGVGFGLGGQQNGFTLELAAAQSAGKANGDSATNQNTQVTASNTLTLQSGRDANLLGAQAKGDTVKATVGRDLNIVSQQDTDNFQSKQSSAGFSASVCIPPFCYGTTASGSVAVSKANTNSTYASVVEQSGLYAGKGGYDITVKGNTDLKGAVIASTAEAAKNKLTTGTLTTSDLQNHARFKSDSFSMNLSYSGGNSGQGGGFTAPGNAIPGANGQLAGGTALQTVTSNLASNAAANALPDQKGKASGTTKSAISDGAIVITDEAGQLAKTGKTAEETLVSLNRDTTTANGAVQKIFDQAALQRQKEEQQVLSQIAQQAAPMLYKQVGNELVGQPTEVKVAVHALVGGVMSKLVGGEFGSGAAGAAAATLIVEKFGEDLKQIAGLNKPDQDALVMLVGLAVSKTVASASGASDTASNAAAITAKLGVENNYLKHKQIEQKKKELENCKSVAECDGIKEKWDRVNKAQTQEALACLTNGKCDSIMMSIDDIKRARDELKIACETFCKEDALASLKELNNYFLPNGEINLASLKTGKVNLEQVGKSSIGLAGSIAGTGTGIILTGAGVSLMFVPELGFTKLSGALTLSAGLANITDAGYGLYSNVVNLYRATQGGLVYLPDGGFGRIAEGIAPGSQVAQDYANIMSLGLALGSGRVFVGTAPIYGGSALAHNVPVGINGMLDARAVAPSGIYRNVLIPNPNYGTSTASRILDDVQKVQLVGKAYEYTPRLLDLFITNTENKK